MSEIYESIIARAKQLGACEKLVSGMDLEQLSALMWSPQGREWMIANDYPTAGSLEAIPSDKLPRLVYVNYSGNADNNGFDCAFIGTETNAIVRINGTEALHHIVALDGAHVRVEASGYAVISIEASASAEVTVINTDKTARISCHRQGK